MFEFNSFDVLRMCGLAAEPAPTNDLEPRIRAVENFFIRNVSGQPGILIDGTRCPTLVAALNGQYKFATTLDASGGMYVKSVPEKLHPWSDVADCLQYVCLVTGNAGAYAWVLGRIVQSLKPRRPMRVAPSSLAWT